MVVPARLSQVETRGESIVPHIHRVLESDVIQDGLYFLQVMKWGVLQYCVIRPLYVI
jgi:hypothetical protein